MNFTEIKLKIKRPKIPNILSKFTEYLKIVTLINLARNANGILDILSQDKRYFKSVTSDK